MDKSSNKFQQGWKKACNCTQQDLQKYGVCFSDCSWFHSIKKDLFFYEGREKCENFNASLRKVYNVCGEGICSLKTSIIIV